VFSKSAKNPCISKSSFSILGPTSHFICGCFTRIRKTWPIAPLTPVPRSGIKSSLRPWLYRPLTPYNVKQVQCNNNNQVTYKRSLNNLDFNPRAYLLLNNLFHFLCRTDGISFESWQNALLSTSTILLSPSRMKSFSISPDAGPQITLNFLPT
jgi:hypothetical protein